MLQHILQIGFEQPPRRFPKPPRLIRLGSECLHHHVSAERLLQNLRHFGLAILCTAAGAADAAADLRHWKYDQRNYSQADEGKLPIFPDNDQQQSKGGERLPE